MHCWHWSWWWRQPSQFRHYYETYLSCFDYKNIYWIVRLSNWILHDVLKESSHSHIARVQNWPEITIGHSLGESLDLGLGQEVPWILKWQSVSEWVTRPREVIELPGIYFILLTIGSSPFLFQEFKHFCKGSYQPIRQGVWFGENSPFNLGVNGTMVSIL